MKVKLGRGEIMARPSHNTTMTILVVLVCLAIGYASWLSLQRVAEIYLAETERTITHVKEGFLTSILSNILEEIEHIRAEEHANWRQMVDLRLQLLSFAPEWSEEQFAAYFTHLFPEPRGDWTALLVNQATGEVLHQTGVELTLDSPSELLYYHLVQHGDLVGLWGVGRNVVESKAQTKIKERLAELKFANGTKFSISQGLSAESEEPSEQVTASAFYEDYNWLISIAIALDELESYQAITGVESERLALLLSLRLVLLMVLLVILGVGLVVVVEHIHHRRRTARLEMAVSEDHLTGACSRRAGTQFLRDAFTNFHISGLSPCILMFDVDNLKQINDSCGHHGGDQVLQGVVSAVGKQLADTDQIIRWGGDEFVVILYNLQTGEVAGVCRQIVQAVSSLEFKFGKASIRPTISLGAACFLPEDVGFMDAVNRADQALYEAKRSGKNRVSLAIEDSSVFADINCKGKAKT